VKRLAAAAAVLLIFSACFGEGEQLTETGKGYPQLTVDFPETTTSGTTETAALTVTNPGPGDMGSIVVAFGRLGDPALPAPLVDVTARNREGAVKEVRPAPNAVSPDGITYTFDGLPVGESVTIEFDIEIPRLNGVAGNAVQVYEGQDPNRARGVPLRTEVGG